MQMIVVETITPKVLVLLPWRTLTSFGFNLVTLVPNSFLLDHNYSVPQRLSSHPGGSWVKHTLVPGGFESTQWQWDISPWEAEFSQKLPLRSFVPAASSVTPRLSPPVLQAFAGLLPPCGSSLTISFKMQIQIWLLLSLISSLHPYHILILSACLLLPGR